VNASSYLWTFQGATPSTSTDVDPTNICYNTPGSYAVSLIATNTTSSDTLTLNNYITVYPYPPPQGIAQIGDTLFANPGAVSYQWYYNGNIITGATDYYYISSQFGDYNVVATDANGCEVEAVIFGAEAVPSPGSANTAVTLSPNPAKENITISVGSGVASTGQISIFNTMGELIYKGRLQNGHTSVATSLFSPGIYWVELRFNDKIIRTRFVKE
jgi:PKD repeat protein